MDKIIVDEQVFIKTLVHKFSLSLDVDLEIYIGSDVYNWEQSDAGKWILSNSVKQPTLITYDDIETYSTKCLIYAYLKDSDCTFFNLKWGKI